MQKLLLRILTTLIIFGLIISAFYIKISFPQSKIQYTYTPIQSFQIFDLDKHLAKYKKAREDINRQQKLYVSHYKLANKFEQKKQIISETKNFLFSKITNDILPYWHDTEWDFNGTTETPKKGKIACGYFVTTVLLHAGFNIDKVRLSQEPSSVMIDHVCDANSIYTIRDDYQGFLDYMNELHDGVYIVGLDKHTGFLIKKKGKVKFVHSRKPRHVGVIEEEMAVSPTLKKSSIFVIGSVLDNDVLIKKWLS